MSYFWLYCIFHFYAYNFACFAIIKNMREIITQLLCGFTLSKSSGELSNTPILYGHYKNGSILQFPILYDNFTYFLSVEKIYAKYSFENMVGISRTRWLPARESPDAPPNHPQLWDVPLDYTKLYVRIPSIHSLSSIGTLDGEMMGSSKKS